MIDAFTGKLLQFLEAVTPSSNATIAQMFDFADKPYAVRSHPELVASRPRRPPSEMRVTDFFGNQISARFDVERAGGTGRRAVPVLQRDRGGGGLGGQREGAAAAAVLWHPTAATPAGLGAANRHWVIEFCHSCDGGPAEAGAAEAAVLLAFPRAAVRRRRRVEVARDPGNQIVKLFRSAIVGGEEQLVWSGPHRSRGAFTKYGWPTFPELPQVLRRLRTGAGAAGLQGIEVSPGSGVTAKGSTTIPCSIWKL